MNKLFRIAYVLAAIAALCGASQHVHAQNRVALKTNLLYDATVTVNGGVEIGLGDKFSLDISGNFNNWILNDGKRWKHWMVQPEFRYWLCERFAGHFFGVHALGGPWNFGFLPNSIKFLGSDFSVLSNARYEGWGVGAGLAYGYAVVLGKHWNLELEAGAGYIYNQWRGCTECGKDGTWTPHNYFGPTKLAVTLVYIF
ncbi:MAG: DUF3575 domain-containing protein [Bacteroidales bacterium]|nr:DUF3575 domain-containing protein [Bacteroidales bacterium]